MLKALIKELSDDLGFTTPLSSESDGAYLALFDPNLQISLSENESSGITLFTQLAPLPEEHTAVILRKIMSANLLGRETGKSVLGLDADGKQVTFSKLLPLQIAYKEFYDAIEDFVNYADAWRQELLVASSGEE